MKKAAQRAETILQMPPVMKERKPITEVISRDLALTRHDTCKLIITDITFGLSDRTRPIFTREPDGTLRHATWEERTRMNEIYNPQPGRKLKTPKMFEDEYLK
ncbi:28S ribosomal protein S22, mitochondrial, partial [Halocaridina rubra]